MSTRWPRTETHISSLVTRIDLRPLQPPQSRGHVHPLQNDFCWDSQAYRPVTVVSVVWLLKFNDALTSFPAFTPNSLASSSYSNKNNVLNVTFRPCHSSPQTGQTQSHGPSKHFRALCSPAGKLCPVWFPPPLPRHGHMAPARPAPPASYFSLPPALGLF